MLNEQRIFGVLGYLPERIEKMLVTLISKERVDIEEIRLRSNSPLTVGVWGESCFITPNGGYITLCGGHRVGICGKAVCSEGKITAFKEISSLNFRIANQILGIADGVMDKIVCGAEVNSTLVIAKPQMGKTTLLRDIIRQVSDRGFKCGIADDRGELGAVYGGVPCNNVGAQTDIIDGAPKAAAIEMLLRTMSPKVIISDEIASDKDVAALRLAAGTGVKIIASTHGDSVEDVLSRPMLAPLFRDGIFNRAIVLRRDFSTPDSVTYTEAVEL